MKTVMNDECVKMFVITTMDKWRFVIFANELGGWISEWQAKSDLQNDQDSK